MKKLLNNPLVVGCLVVAAVIVGFWPQLQTALAQRTVRPAPASAISEAAESEAADLPADIISLTRRIRAALDADSPPASDRNLFAYAEKSVPVPEATVLPAAVETQSVRLGALWLQADVSLALLDDRIAVSGDRIGFVDVAEISAEGVWLVHRGQRTFVQLGEQHTFTQSTDPTDPALP